jgi:hypothetical protein
MRLLSVLLTAIGFLLFAMEAAKLLTVLKGATVQLIEQFNHTNQLLNERNKQLAKASA